MRSGLFATGKAFEGLSLRAALLDEGRRKTMDVQGLRVWEHATREILEPAGLTTIGDVLALPAQDVDIESRTSKEGLASRAKQLRELALPSGLLRYLVQVRAGQHDASLSELASTLESRRPVNTKEGDAARPEVRSS